ncbi:MAG: hypothetical protein FD133_1162 [Erysipelotrichaceae bacterium]|nr:MAG: hypothetical protein FD179_1104 [Erysipelotrichaceae bacterium]TXT17878.1 MAG: hypothetical protein FD133_1162 [Erysipelotrichaceae bacterium]
MSNYQSSSVNLSQDQAYNQIKNDPSILVIDVRSKEEFDDAHIIGSINVDIYGEFLQDIQQVCPNQDHLIFIVCASGSRASSAVSMMRKIGYTNVFNIGGMGSWKYETNIQ